MEKNKTFDDYFGPDIDEMLDEIESRGYEYIIQFMLIRKRDNLRKFSDLISYIVYEPSKEDPSMLHRKIEYTEEIGIRIGARVLLGPVGDFFTWMTTEITKIIEIREPVVHFLTTNSEYKLVKGHDNIQRMKDLHWDQI